jgi:hypothetical protein
MTAKDVHGDGHPTLRASSGESAEKPAVPLSVFDAQSAVAAIDWDARLKAAVAKTIAARDRRRNERVVFAENRAWGLQQRYRAKEDRDRSSAVTADETRDAQ